jgi:hypothetical protein
VALERDHEHPYVPLPRREQDAADTRNDIIRAAPGLFGNEMHRATSTCSVHDDADTLWERAMAAYRSVLHNIAVHLAAWPSGSVIVVAAN